MSEKKGTQPRYDVCRGRHKERHLDGSPTCNLPYIRADRLEFLVWNKVKQVFAKPATLKQYAEKALDEFEQRKTQIGEDFLNIQKDMAGIKKKEER